MEKNKKIFELDIETTYLVEDINIEKLIPNVIDNFAIAIIDGHHTTVLPPNVYGPQFKTWSKGRGGVFSRDILKYSRGLKHGKYVIIKEVNKKFIARIISEEELLEFKTLKLVSGQIKDISYMFLKEIQDESFVSTKLEITNDEETTISEDIEFVSRTPKNNEAQEEEFEVKRGSISLFSD